MPGTYYGKPNPGNSYFASVGSSLHWVGAAGASPNGIFMYGGGDNEQTIFPQTGARAPARGVRDVTDGTSNTFLIVEAKNPVEWTRPDDYGCAIVTEVGPVSCT